MASKRLDAFPKRQVAIKAPIIKSPSTGNAPSIGSQPPSGAKPNWRQQREEEERRKKEEEMRLKAEKDKKLKELTTNDWRTQTTEDPILARIRGVYTITEEDVVITADTKPVSAPQQTNAQPSFKAPTSTPQQNNVQPSFKAPASTPQQNNVQPSFKAPTSTPQQTYVQPSFQAPAAIPPVTIQADFTESNNISTAPVFKDEFQVEIDFDDPPTNPVSSAPVHQVTAAANTPVVIAQQDEPLCSSCSNPLSGAVIEAKGKRYHQACFKCSGCSKTFTGGVMIYEIEGNPFCAECKAQRSGSTGVSSTGSGSDICAKCNKPIDVSGVEALGARWHPNCFTCTSCHNPFTSSYVNYKGSPYCKPCAEREADIEAEKEMGHCGGCGLLLRSGTLVNVNGQNYHLGCFKCTQCGKPFEKEYYSHEGKPYCATCHPAN